MFDLVCSKQLIDCILPNICFCVPLLNKTYSVKKANLKYFSIYNIICYNMLFYKDYALYNVEYVIYVNCYKDYALYNIEYVIYVNCYNFLIFSFQFCEFSQTFDLH